MALTNRKAARVRKTDLIIGRNALDPDKVAQLNRIAAMLPGSAEDHANQRKDLRMSDWRQNVDRFAAFNERPLLRGTSEVSQERMQQIVHARYAVFDAKRRKEEAVSADVEDIEPLESVEKSAHKGRNDAT